MSLAVDLKNKKIHAGFGELTEPLRERFRGQGLLSRMRTELGSRVHGQYRTERQEGPEEFTAEVGVSLTHEVDGFTATLRGRVDGLIRRGETLLIEEVKSISLGAEDLSWTRGDTYPEYAFQLRLYGLALQAEHPGTRIQLRLVLISLLDGGRVEIPLEPYPEATRDKLNEVLRFFVEQAERTERRGRELKALATRIRFPYTHMRPHQAELIEAMDQGLGRDRPVLAMAPTGIGKTVSALVAGLRFALGQDALLFFTTAKTTQQELVEKTFEDIVRAAGLPPGVLRCLTLRAKERMCPTHTLLCHPEVCPFLEDFQGRLEKSRLMDQLLVSTCRIEPEAILLAGEQYRLCPFALSLALVEHVHLVVCDYNYVYDPGVALAEYFGEEAERATVVIVDEAHNLFDRARGAYSPFIARAELERLVGKIQANEFLASRERTAQLPLSLEAGKLHGPTLFGQMEGLCAELAQLMDQTQRHVEEQELPGEEDCRVVEADHTAWQGLANRAAEMGLSYALYNRLHRLVHPRDPLADLLSKIMRIRDILGYEEREFVHYVAGPRAPLGSGIGILCVNPAQRLTLRHRQVRGTLAMSATLTPLSYYGDVLGFSGLEPLCVSMPSPFPWENLGVFIVNSLSTALRKRDENRAAIGRIITETFQAHPGRYAAYFPSYKFLSVVRPCLDLPSDQVLVQLPGMDEASRRTLLNLLRRSQGPRLLLAVMGGAFSEGIDLPGSELIGAIIIGPGLPQVGFERTLMQLYFEEKYEKGFSYAMLYPGMQRVIQAAGRVIRTPEDQGLIVLVDQRFGHRHVAACLPEHWYRAEPSELITPDLPKSVEAFWKSLGQAPCTHRDGACGEIYLR